MTRMRKTFLIVALTALAALPFVGRLATVPAANAETGVIPQEAKDAKATKVSYLPIPAGDYNVDKNHSVIGFTIRHNELALVGGRFKDFTAAIHFDDKDISKSSVEFTAKVESIDTGVTGRDNHLRTADFFEVAKYPEMTFKSTKVERKGKGYVLNGDLTIKGVTKQVVLPFIITGAIKDGRGNTRIGISAQTKIDRRDYGITWGHALATGGFDVAHDVTIEIQLEALQPAPAAPKPAG